MTLRRLLTVALLLAVAGAAPADSQSRVHRVAAGDTLYRIAKQHGVTVELLQRANGIADPTRLSTGQALTIPRAHVMQKGDTIYSISRTYGVAPAVILAANEIIDPTQVHVGQVLLIPEAFQQSQPRQVARAAGTVPAAVGGEQRLWPMAGKRTPLTGKLSGLKISGTEGEAVRSVSSGTVRWASPSRGFGQVVLVENPLGYIFGYLGNAETFVAVGDQVEIGTELGRLGLNPHDHKANLYFLVFKDGQPADPWRAPRV